MKKIIVYWSRRDFRISDNPALLNAVEKSKEINAEFLPIFVLEDYMLKAESNFQFGFPSRFFLSKAIPEFAKNFDKFVLVTGKGAQTFIDLQKEFNNDFKLEIHVNEDVYIDFYKQVKKILKQNIKIIIYKDQLTVDKNLKSGTGNFYSVFTPFKKACWQNFLKEKILPQATLKNLNYISEECFSRIKNKIEINTENIWNKFSKKRNIKVGKHEIDLNEILGQTDKYDLPYKNEKEAIEHFQNYLKNDLIDYKNDRDSLEKNKTSKMSLALTWGLVSARILKQEIIYFFDNDFYEINWSKIEKKNLGPIHYISELIWREFYKYLFFHNPNLIHEEFQEKFKYKVEWVEDKIAIERFIKWIKGETGYKIVDAAMHELKKTGLMHNRSRMIVASILTKNLGVDWRWGQEYFRAMLLDLDEASNNGGWQWGASVGADPKPIRIFNPYLQAENYDANSVYQKKWLGEKFNQNIIPIVDHKEARENALKRYGLYKEKN